MRVFRYRRSQQSDVLHFCPVCNQARDTFANGPGGRPNARCDLCQSLERHRYLALLLESFRDDIVSSQHLLEIAPTPSVTRLLRGISGGTYVGVDVDPSADGRRVQVIADLCMAPFPDGIFDTSVCFHVFEHIPNDVVAMREYARLLAPKGIGFIQNPWRAGSRTDEDPSAPTDERIRRFGQADHVRMYGSDFEDRLRFVGLRPRRLMPESVVRDDLIDVMGIQRNVPIWVVCGALSSYAPLSDNDFAARVRKGIDAYLAGPRVPVS